MTPAGAFLQHLETMFRRREPGRPGSGFTLEGKRLELIVFENSRGNAIGAVSMIARGPETVEICLVVANDPQHGDGTRMLDALCLEADRDRVTLKVQPAPQTEEGIQREKLKEWYRRFGFVGEQFMERAPRDRP